MERKKQNQINMSKKAAPLKIVLRKGESEEHAVARTMLSPSLQSASTVHEYLGAPPDIDLGALVDCIEKQVDQVKEGDLQLIDQILLSQAHSLDAIANNLLRRAVKQEHMGNLETYTKLGLRAQSQCRATLETLVQLKKPPAELIRQTNIAQTQQVNNFPEKEKTQSKILENNDHEPDKWLDTGAQKEAIRNDQDLEAVEARHRTKNS